MLWRHYLLPISLALCWLSAVALFSSGCASPEIKEPIEATDPVTGGQVVLLRVQVNERTVADNLRSQVCTPQTREFDDPYDPNAAKWRLQLHVTSVMDDCTQVTFTCRDGSTHSKKVCLKQPVDTGCKSSSNKPVLISVSSL